MNRRDPEVEAVAEALWDDITARWSRPVPFAEADDKALETYRRDAQTAIEALDRFRAEAMEVRDA